MSEFRAVRDLAYVKLLDAQPPFIHREQLTGAQAQGYRYERKVQGKLEQLVKARPELLLSNGAWLEFCEHGAARRWCQVDAFVRNQETGNAICYEVKYRHTADAWFQLWRLYVPILTFLYPSFRWEGCEIVKWFDPATSFPEAFSLSPNPFVVPIRGRTAVHIWNPSRD